MASGPRVTRERFDQVKKGMSREEVIRTVGGPPGDYSSGKALRADHDFSVDWDDYQTWLCDDGLLGVRFDDTATATEVAVIDISDATLIERIRRWLGL
jgi:hypothetical protein